MSSQNRQESGREVENEKFGAQTEGEKEYKTYKDIVADVKDLAGVRAVLYTPNEDQ